MPRPAKGSPAPRSPKQTVSKFVHSKIGPKPDIKQARVCYSCSTRVTPYWRDGWSPGILLCNACGLRFSKYRKVCHICKAIGIKANFERITCPICKTCLD